ncbi:MAG: carboxypeptidase regulatory-like domain-containing protein [Rhodanobacteraceae bacterium]
MKRIGAFSRPRQQLALLSLCSLLATPPALAGSVSGHVYDEQGQPLQGAHVKVLDTSLFGNYTLVGEDSTDASGAFEIADVSGNLYLSAYLDDVHTVGLPGGDTCVLPYGCQASFTTHFTVAESQSLVVDDTTLYPAGTLDFIPLEGASPSMGSFNVYVEGSGGASFSITRSGSIHLPSLPEDDYRVRIEPQNIDFLNMCGNDSAYDALVDSPCQSGTEIHATAGFLATIPIHLQKGVVFSGTLIDAHTGEAPDSNYTSAQAVSTTNPDLLLNARQGASGYTIGPLLPRSYFMRFVGGDRYVAEYYDNVPCLEQPCDTTGATVFTPDPGEHLTGIDAAIEPRQWISGHVTDAQTSQPLRGIRVEKMSTQMLWDTWFWVADSVTYTDDQGGFEFDGIEPGGFTLRASDARHRYVAMQLPASDCDFDNNFCAGVPIDTSGGSWNAPYTLLLDQPQTAFEIAMHKGPLVSGTVMNASTGGPLSGARISLYGPGEAPYVQYLTTDASGAFSTSAINATVLTAAATNDQYGQLYQNVACPSESECDPAAGTPIDLNSQAPRTDINFALPPDTNTLFSSGFESW